MTVLGLLAAVSTAGAVWFSVMNRALRSPDYEYVGLYNYLRLLRDKRFFNALEISLIWELITVTGTLAVAITCWPCWCMKPSSGPCGGT
ncbi:MAG: hypothetical protein U5N10_15865 [Gemmobacter sp.]|nr:hypothetical protein [Gemmobacter sp.]